MATSANTIMGNSKDREFGSDKNEKSGNKHAIPKAEMRKRNGDENRISNPR